MAQNLWHPGIQKASEAAMTAQIDSGANRNSSLLEDDIPPEKLGQNTPNLLSVLAGSVDMAECPQVMPISGTRERLLAIPLRRAQPSTIPHVLLGKKPLIV